MSVALFLAGRIKGRLRTFDMQKDANLTKTPTKIYSPDQFCRLCQCNIAIVGRGKCNIFSGKSSDGLARRLSIVLDAPVEKEDSVSSNVCYKCKREMEKYEGYMKALNIDLKAFRERCEKSVGEQRSRQHVPVKRCHCICILTASNLDEAVNLFSFRNQFRHIQHFRVLWQGSNS